MALKQSLQQKLLYGPSLIGADGEEGYSPGDLQAGPSIEAWGRQQAMNDRANEDADWFSHFGQEGHGFGPTSRVHALPDEWEIMGKVMQGRQRAVEAQGGKFKMDVEDAYNDAPQNTRWDTNQVGIDTGQNLGQDLSDYQDSINKVARPTHGIMSNLQRHFGVDGAQSPLYQDLIRRFQR